MRTASIFEMVRAGKPLPKRLGAIDVHAHFGRYRFAIPEITAESFVKMLDRAGISEAWCSHMQCMSCGCREGNDELLRAAKAYPSRFKAMASFWPESPEAVRKEAERCFKTGFFIGMKFHNMIGFPYDHPSFRPAYEIANECRMPVLFHTWGEEPVFSQISKIAGEFPDISVMLAHAGSVNAPGYIRMAKKHENVYLDLALSRSSRGLVESLAAGCGVEKILFGSDIYFLDLGQQLGKVAGADLGENDKAAIFGGNARRIRGRIRL